jgi:Ras-related protein Rab-7A
MQGAGGKKKSFLKIVIIGDSSVGKTTLLQQYLNGKVIGNAKPTIGADFSKKETMIDNQVVTLQIWDTAGQEKFQSLGYAFYRGADCCVLVYDITNRKTFENLTKWKQGFIDNAAPDDPKTFPFVVLGNKIDRESERKVDGKEGKEWCDANSGIPFYETSAKEGISVEQAFHEIARKALRRMETNAIVMPDTISGASGAIRLNSNLSNPTGGAGSNPGGATKSKPSCC